MQQRRASISTDHSMALWNRQPQRPPMPSSVREQYQSECLWQSQKSVGLQTQKTQNTNSDALSLSLLPIKHPQSEQCPTFTALLCLPSTRAAAPLALACPLARWSARTTLPGRLKVGLHFTRSWIALKVFFLLFLMVNSFVEECTTSTSFENSGSIEFY